MAAESAGTIVYDVEVDLSGLLNGQRQINSALEDMTNDMRNLQGSLARTERSVESIEGAFSDLSSVAKGVFAALSVQQVGAYAQAWQDLSNKLSNAVRDSVPPFETLADVTERVFNIAQRTRSGLESTAELYARLERSTRSYGVSVDQLAKLTTIINQGFIVSGASAEEASNAITQLAQGLASGALRGDEFNSVNEQGNRLMIALADSMGVGIGQLRNMAAEGKLTTDVIVNGLLSQGSEIGAEFAKTTATIGQSMEIAGNNVTKFFGENSTVKTGVKIFSDGIITMSENIEALGGVLTLAAAVMGGRYAGSIAMATAAKVQDIAASRARLLTENQTAQATLVAANNTVRRSLADKEAAISAMNLAQAEYNVARGSSAEALALENLIATKTAARNASLSLAQAEMAQAAAQTQAAAAARAASVSIGLARGALSLIGGPAGVAMLAGAAIFYFYQKAQQAKQESIDLADKLDGVISKMREMNQTQLQGTIADLNTSIRNQVDNLNDLRNAHQENVNQLYNARQAMSNATEGSWAYNSASESVAELQDKVARSARDVDTAETKLSRTKSTLGMAQAQLSGNLSQGIDLLRRDGHEAGVAAGLMNQFGNALYFASRQKDKFNSSSLKVERPKNVQDYLDKLLDQVEIEGEIDERKRAQLKVEKEIRALGGDDAAVNLARQRAAAEYDAQKAQSELKKETRATASEQKKSVSQVESIAQKLADLKQQSELAGDSTRELSREQSILTAQQSLGKGATQEQIALAGQYAAQKWDVTNALKAQAAAEKLLPEARENASYKQDVQDLETALAAKKISQEQYNATSEQLEATHQANLAKIRANQVVTPQQQAAGTVDPVQQLANENAQKLALIQQYEQQGVITHQNALALKNAADTQYEQQRTAAQWELLSQQSIGYDMLTSAVDAFAGNASNALTGLLTGTMSVDDALRSLGNTILNSVINSIVQMGVEYAKNLIIQQTLGTAAVAATSAQALAAAAAWATPAALAATATSGGAAVAGNAALATTVGSAQAMALAGARKNGGPVSAGGLYQVGESGLPEIYQASNGRQYMIPGDNGSVISNKDLQGGGGINVQLNVQNYSGATVDAQASSDGNGGVTIDMIVADLNNGGPVSQGIVSNFNVKRKARGQG